LVQFTRPSSTRAATDSRANLCWDLRRLGGGAAWSIDVTSDPTGSDPPTLEPRRLTDVARYRGLVPTMIDRLS
jgi:hypothetical protein